VDIGLCDWCGEFCADRSLELASVHLELLERPDDETLLAKEKRLRRRLSHRAELPLSQVEWNRASALGILPQNSELNEAVARYGETAMDNDRAAVDRLKLEQARAARAIFKLIDGAPADLKAAADAAAVVAVERATASGEIRSGWAAQSKRRTTYDDTVLRLLGQRGGRDSPDRVG
jgi:hypothetical protein